jgi:acetylornithine deacetylase/succinyl-diaminopimelate desuccinylase-like protein
VVKKEQQLSVADETLQQSAINLLKTLIATPSYSKAEERTASVIESFLSEHGIETKRHLNNVWCVNKYSEPRLPTVLLNSHHDTVKPNPGYTVDPFTPLVKDGKLFGLGSNDAGGALVSLIAAFIHYYNKKDLPFNIVLAATGEEEISGENGVEALLPYLPPIEAAVVGEPTLLQLAIAERGLMVLDCTATGKAGHAARQEGENALYKAMNDIRWFREYQFNKVSPLLGPVQMTVTSIETENKAHNVVPAKCDFIVDVRINELYSMDEVMNEISSHIKSEIHPRSTRLRSTNIALDHPLVKAGISMGSKCYGSPTTSDKALMPFPSLKAGPGDSARSHTADEFIFVDEVRKGIEFYVKLLDAVRFNDR